MKSSQLYFIAIIPPTEIEAEILQIKQYVWETYDSKAALRSPPHITLFMPFRYPVDKEELLIAKLEEFVRQFNPFKVQLENYGLFPPRVIFIDVHQNPKMEDIYFALDQWMKKQLKIVGKDNPYRGFTPHLTIAFRDLKKANFKIAWEYFEKRSFKKSFSAEGVCLLKHNGKFWEKHHQMSFNPEN